MLSSRVCCERSRPLKVGYRKLSSRKNEILELVEKFVTAL